MHNRWMHLWALSRDRPAAKAFSQLLFGRTSWTKQVPGSHRPPLPLSQPAHCSRVLGFRAQPSEETLKCHLGAREPAESSLPRE